MELICKACNKRGKTCFDCENADKPLYAEKKRICRSCGRPCSDDRYFNCRTCVTLETDDEVYNHLVPQSKKKKGAA